MALENLESRDARDRVTTHEQWWGGMFHAMETTSLIPYALWRDTTFWRGKSETDEILPRSLPRVWRLITDVLRHYLTYLAIQRLSSHVRSDAGVQLYIC